MTAKMIFTAPMRRRSRTAWLPGLAWGMLFFCGTSFSSLAIETATSDWSQVVRPLRRDIQEAVSAKQIPDLQLAFAVDKSVVWSEVLHGQPGGNSTTETRFRVGSVSKSITATALFKLVEEGKIDLDRPITGYFPCDVPQADQMTARLLAGHLAGIRHYLGDEMINSRHYDTLKSGLAIFSGSPLVAPPGTKYSYSSYGFNLLGCVMEAAAHEDFPSLVKEQVLVPLHMVHTEIDDLTRPLQRVAATYERSLDGTVKPIKPSDDSYKWPSGGYISTAEDLTLLGDAYLDPGFLSAASLQAAETPQSTTAGKPTGYSLGWTVSHDVWNHVLIDHSGEAIGGGAWLCVCPAKGAVFAAAWNAAGNDKDILLFLMQISRDLMDAK